MVFFVVVVIFIPSFLLVCVNLKFGYVFFCFPSSNCKNMGWPDTTLGNVIKR